MVDDITERVAHVVVEAITRIETANQARLQALRRRVAYLTTAVVILFCASMISCFAGAYLILNPPGGYLSTARSQVAMVGEDALRAQTASVERAVRAMEQSMQNLAAHLAAQRSEHARVIQAEVARQIKEAGADKEVFIITAPEGAKVNVRR